MKVIITRTTFVNGDLAEKSKKPVEVSDKDGATLIGLKKAVPAEKAEDPKEKAAK